LISITEDKIYNTLIRGRKKYIGKTNKQSETQKGVSRECAAISTNRSIWTKRVLAKYTSEARNVEVTR
jgi:hypothetical protein